MWFYITSFLITILYYITWVYSNLDSDNAAILTYKQKIQKFITDLFTFKR